MKIFNWARYRIRLFVKRNILKNINGIYDFVVLIQGVFI